MSGGRGRASGRQVTAGGIEVKCWIGFTGGGCEVEEEEAVWGGF